MVGMSSQIGMKDASDAASEGESEDAYPGQAEQGLQDWLVILGFLGSVSLHTAIVLQVRFSVQTCKMSA